MRKTPSANDFSGHSDHCEAEPIRFPGGIQPSGVLLCVDLQSMVIVAASANHHVIPELAPELGPLVIGRTLREVWPVLDTGIQEGAIEDGGLRDGAFMVGNDYMVIYHSDPRTLFVEIESCTETDRSGALHLMDLGSVLIRLHDAATLDGVTHVAADAIRRITGMERVLVYRFDKDGHGEVMAESKVADWEESFIGFHFPSADIPAQARALYLNSPCRFAPNRDYEPVPIIPERDPRTGQPFDLGRCRLRSLSHVHRMYQQNLGVDGAMSISIIDQGKLWGLVVAAITVGPTGFRCPPGSRRWPSPPACPCASPRPRPPRTGPHARNTSISTPNCWSRSPEPMTS